MFKEFRVSVPSRGLHFSNSFTIFCKVTKSESFRPLAGTAFLKCDFRNRPRSRTRFRPLTGTAFLKFHWLL